VFTSPVENVRSQQLDHADHLAVNIPDCWSGDRKSTAFKRAATNTWNRQCWWRLGRS